MNKLRTVIIDDEPVARKGIEKYVEQTVFLSLIGSFSSPTKLHIEAKKENVDLLLLDIKLHKLNGLDFYKSLGESAPFVIIISAYSEYALDGFELNVTDYLVKPVPYDRFLKAVLKVKELFELKKTSNVEYDAKENYFFIKSDLKFQRINLEDILFIEGMSNYVIIHTESKKFITYLTFRGLLEKLPKNDFVRIHKSYVVSLRKIDSIDVNEVKIGLVNLPLSKYYKETVMSVINERLFRR